MERLGELNIGGNVRVHRVSPESSDKLLGLTSRAHVIRYRGWVSVWGPDPAEMFDVHGEDAKALIQKIEQQGGYAISLKLGDHYAIENPRRTSPTRHDFWDSRPHRHPDPFMER